MTPLSTFQARRPPEITGILQATPVCINGKLQTAHSVFHGHIDFDHVTVLNQNQTGNESGPNGSSSDGVDVVPADDEVVVAVLKVHIDGYAETRRAQFQNISCHPKLFEQLTTSLDRSLL